MVNADAAPGEAYTVTVDEQANFTTSVAPVQPVYYVESASPQTVVFVNAQPSLNYGASEYQYVIPVENRENHHHHHHDSNRKWFMMKVYLILAAMLAVTIGLTCIMIYVQPVRNFVNRSIAMLVSSLVIMPIALIALFFVRHKKFVNVIVLCIFTLSMAYLVGTCAAYPDDPAYFVVEAFVIAISATIIVMVFTMFAKPNIMLVGSLLLAFCWVALWWGLMAFLFMPSYGWFCPSYYSCGYGIWPQIWCFLGIIIFLLLVIVDTWRIAKLFPDNEYILGAITLYIDIINLFLLILACRKR